MPRRSGGAGGAGARVASRTMRRWSLIVLAAAVSVAVCAAPAAWATPGDGVLSMLVMGDSYSAGNGAGDYVNKTCWRSPHNYGSELKRIVESRYHQLASLRTIACSGDTTAQFTAAKAGRPPQLTAVNRGYDLILLTIGGNDIKFSSIVKFCLIARFRDDDHCAPLLAEAEDKLSDGTVERPLKKLLTSIQDRADATATIVLVGYPYLEGDPKYTLRDSRGALTQVGKRVRRIGDAGDALQQRVVSALNRRPGAPKLVLVKTKKLFEGPPNHGLYAKRNNPNRWFIQPFIDAARNKTLPGPELNTFYHPNPTGWHQEAELLARDPRVPKRDLAAPPATVPTLPPPPAPAPPLQMVASRRPGCKRRRSARGGITPALFSPTGASTAGGATSTANSATGRSETPTCVRSRSRGSDRRSQSARAPATTPRTPAHY